MSANVTNPDMIDFDSLMGRFKGRSEFVIKLLDSIQRTNKDYPERIVKAAANKDYKDIAFVAHSIKSMAGNIMADRVFEFARMTEESARSAEEESIEYARELSGMMSSLLEEIQVVIEG